MRRFLPSWVPGAGAPEPGTLQASFHPGMKLEDQSTVVLLGRPGAGKSSLGNLLVFGNLYDKKGFGIGHGADAMTTRCELKTCLYAKCRLTVYDSPGVPDTDSAKTFDRFDEIVETIRGLTSLNGIVFLIENDRLEEGDYGVFHTLLKQFSKLPCPIVMVCRVDTPDCEQLLDEDAKLEQAAHELLDRVIDKSELGRDRVNKFLLHHGDLGVHDANVLRWYVCMMPGLAVARETLLTTGEVEARFEALSSRQTRIEELRQERDDLVKSLEKLDDEIVQLRDRIQPWLVGEVAAGALAVAACTDIYALGVMTLVLYGAKVVRNAAMQILGAQIAGWKGALNIANTNRARLDADIRQKTQEIESGRVNSQRLEVICEEREELRTLLKR